MLSISLFAFGCSDSTNNTDSSNRSSTTINMVVNNQTFTVTLADNTTANDFVNLLPLSISMSELNGNEKYYYLPSGTTLTTNTYSPGSISTGDLMLYGSNCIVVFYDSFSTSYSYSRIGWIENTTNLASVLGTSSVSVTFNN